MHDGLNVEAVYSLMLLGFEDGSKNCGEDLEMGWASAVTLLHSKGKGVGRARVLHRSRLRISAVEVHKHEGSSRPLLIPATVPSFKRLEYIYMHSAHLETPDVLSTQLMEAQYKRTKAEFDNDLVLVSAFPFLSLGNILNCALQCDGVHRVWKIICKITTIL